MRVVLYNNGLARGDLQQKSHFQKAATLPFSIEAWSFSTGTFFFSFNAESWYFNVETESYGVVAWFFDAENYSYSTESYSPPPPQRQHE